VSLINCSSDCIYQSEGICTLDKAAEITNKTADKGCLHYVSKSKRGEESGQDKTKPI
jgi:hypothetical protein